MSQPIRVTRREARSSSGLTVTAVRGERDFRRARRHSRAVRVLRIALPLVVLLGAGGLVARTMIGFGGAAPVGFADIIVEQDALVMEKPHVSGLQADGSPYELRAERAVQSTADPGTVTLEGINALLGLGGEERATVGAGRGVFNVTGTKLELSEGITVTTQSGLEAVLQEADVDLSRGMMQSFAPVEVRSADGTIRGNAMEISEGGRRVTFSGGVSMTFAPVREQGAPAAAAEAAD